MLAFIGKCEQKAIYSTFGIANSPNDVGRGLRRVSGEGARARLETVRGEGPDVRQRVKTIRCRVRSPDDPLNQEEQNRTQPPAAPGAFEHALGAGARPARVLDQKLRKRAESVRERDERLLRGPPAPNGGLQTQVQTRALVGPDHAPEPPRTHLEFSVTSGYFVELVLPTPPNLRESDSVPQPAPADVSGRSRAQDGERARGGRESRASDRPADPEPATSGEGGRGRPSDFGGVWVRGHAGEHVRCKATPPRGDEALSGDRSRVRPGPSPEGAGCDPGVRERVRNQRGLGEFVV